jgi:predicted acetyltransferase
MPNPQVRVRVAAATERPVLEALFPLYVHDFSELEPASSARFELGPDGRFDAYPLDDYWQRDGFVPLLIHAGERLVGFALVNTESHHGGAVAHNLAELFVVRKHRRAGVGAAAAGAILEAFPGRWEVAVAERNVAAKAFWARVLAANPAVKGLESGAGDGVHWRGPIWHFVVA